MRSTRLRRHHLARRRRKNLHNDDPPIIGIARAEAARLGDGVRGLGACAEGLAVRERQEVLHRALDDAQAVRGEAQVGDDLRVQQADGVTGRGIAEAGHELLGDRGAADDRAPFEHGDAQPGARQVAGTGEAVVAGTDDQDVETGGGGLAAG